MLVNFISIYYTVSFSILFEQALHHHQHPQTSRASLLARAVPWQRWRHPCIDSRCWLREREVEHRLGVRKRERERERESSSLGPRTKTHRNGFTFSTHRLTNPSLQRERVFLRVLKPDLSGVRLLQGKKKNTLTCQLE